MQRRSVLHALALGAATVGLSPLRVTRVSAAPRQRPRFYLHVLPAGGMDAIYATDPKTTREVEPGIDVPFGANAIVDAGGMRLGPSFKALARWSKDLAIVNMFRQNSANHPSGLAHVMRCKSHASSTMPTLFDILGARRDREAIGAACFGTDFVSGASPMYLGEPGRMWFGWLPPLFTHLDRAAPDDLRAAARTLQSQTASFGQRRLNAAEQVTVDNLRATGSLFEHAASAPKFVAKPWDNDLLNGSTDLQRALWLFENGLARCATVAVGMMAFDTHINNANQAALTTSLASLLDRLFTELHERKVDDMTLAEQTVVIVGSEIGRFPRLNSVGGKDHFPQASYVLFGAPFKTGVTYGGTDRGQVTLPVSLDTGKPERGGHVLKIDDLGTTLLALDGANPEVFGYTGTRLKFVEA